MIPLSPMSEAPPVAPPVAPQVAPPVFTAVSVTSMVTLAGSGIVLCHRYSIFIVMQNNNLTCTHTYISCARKQLWYTSANILAHACCPSCSTETIQNSTILCCFHRGMRRNAIIMLATNCSNHMTHACLVYIILSHKLSPSIGSSFSCC